jgi:hypothetical protein
VGPLAGAPGKRSRRPEGGRSHGDPLGQKERYQIFSEIWTVSLSDNFALSTKAVDRRPRSRDCGDLTMAAHLLKRLKRLEEVPNVEHWPQAELQIGRTPQDAASRIQWRTPRRNGWSRCGRHVSVGGATWCAASSEDSPKSIFRIFLVRAKGGRPDYSWPEDVHPV